MAPFMACSLAWVQLRSLPDGQSGESGGSASPGVAPPGASFLLPRGVLRFSFFLLRLSFLSGFFALLFLFRLALELGFQPVQAFLLFVEPSGFLFDFAAQFLGFVAVAFTLPLKFAEAPTLSIAREL